MRVHRLLRKPSSRAALQQAMLCSGERERRAAVRAVVESYERDSVATTSQLISKTIVVFMEYIESLLAPGLTVVILSARRSIH